MVRVVYLFLSHRLPDPLEQTSSQYLPLLQQSPQHIVPSLNTPCTLLPVLTAYCSVYFCMSMYLLMLSPYDLQSSAYLPLTPCVVCKEFSRWI
jgi:hypothetical protein